MMLKRCQISVQRAFLYSQACVHFANNACNVLNEVQCFGWDDSEDPLSEACKATLLGAEAAVCSCNADCWIWLRTAGPDSPAAGSSRTNVPLGPAVVQLACPLDRA